MYHSRKESTQMFFIFQNQVSYFCDTNTIPVKTENSVSDHNITETGVNFLVIQNEKY